MTSHLSDSRLIWSIVLVSVLVFDVLGFTAQNIAPASAIPPPAPAVSTVVNNESGDASGPAAGGTTITVTGTGFWAGRSASDVSGVTVGGVAATSVSVSSDTSLTAVTPAGTVGAQTVVVTTTSGGSSTDAVTFTYVAAPTVSAISPSAGVAAGGTTITVSGAGFWAGGSASDVSGVTVGGVAATSVSVSSDTSLTAVTPAGTVGAQTVVVTTASGGSSADVVNFTYEASARNSATVSSPTKVSPTIARITWTAPSIPGGSSYSIASYAIDYRETPSGSWTTFQSGRSPSLPLRSTITGLSAEGSYEFRVRTVFSDSVESVSSASAAVTMDAACTLPGARSSFVNVNVADPSAGRELFLGGNYIELGISSLGNFGTGTSKPVGFTGSSSSSLGMTVDYDGFDCGQNLSIDFFLPGSPEERWAVGYQAGGSTSYIGLSKLSGVDPNGFDGTNSQIERDTTIVNESTSSILKATITTTLKSSSTPVMEVKQQISFGVDDQYFTNTVTMKNLTGSSWTSVRYMRSFDPDNLVFRAGDYTTNNEVLSTIARDGKAVVRAQAVDSDFRSTVVPQTYDTRAPILFYSSDSSAKASTFGFSNSDPYASQAYASPVAGPIDVDGAITIAFDKGALSAGSSTTLTYITSLDQRDFDVLAAEIAEVEAQAVADASTPSPAPSPSSSGGTETRPVVTPSVTPIVPQRPRQITLPPQPPVQAPVLRNQQAPLPPNTPIINVNGVPSTISTQVTDPNNLSLRAGVLNIGLNVRSDQGLVRQGTNGETEVQVRKGGVAGFQGSGLAPRSFVQVFMPLQGTNAKELARIPVDETGSFNGEATFATSFQEAPLPVGRQVLQMVTVDERGRQNVVEITVNIVQPPPSPEPNREAGVTPELRPGQSLATNAGIPEVVDVTVIPDQKQTLIEGDGWVMSIAPEDENSNVTQNEDGEVLLELVRDESATVAGSGFMPGTRADVWLFSDPTLLGTVDIDENGEFNGTVNIDGQAVNVGEHTLQLQGIGTDGYVRAANLGVLVNDAEAAESTEDAAGGFLWWWLLILLAIAIAVAAYVWWKRRQAQETL